MRLVLPKRYGTARPRLWFLVWASTLGWLSATRQNSASQSLSRMTQFTWFFGWLSRPGVSQRCSRAVLKRTCAVLPVGVLVGVEDVVAHRAFFQFLGGDGLGDAFAGHVRQFLIHQLRGISVALA